MLKSTECQVDYRNVTCTAYYHSLDCKRTIGHERKCVELLIHNCVKKHAGITHFLSLSPLTALKLKISFIKLSYLSLSLSLSLSLCIIMGEIYWEFSLSYVFFKHDVVICFALTTIQLNKVPGSLRLDSLHSIR